jgi:hypothetical protein
MDQLPQEVALLSRMSDTFTKPTAQRFLFLALATIITMGRRTVSHILWSASCLSQGDPSSYHRFFSAARLSLWPLAKVLAAAVLEQVPVGQVVVLDADDTVAQHRGKKVFGKGCHRDAVRSSWTHTVFKWGHKWVVLAVNVRLPLCRRDWALPVMAALYVPPPEGDKDTSAKRHKTPALLARQMVATLIHWFPDRQFVLQGDWGFSSHDLALFCHRHADHVRLIGRLRSDANLYALPDKKPRTGPGRHPRKGKKLPCPAETVARAKNRARVTLCWYGNSKREVEILSGCAGWYRGRGQGRAALIPIRWVYVHDKLAGREDYFFSTDPSLTPTQIVESFASRWNIEVTFEEIRAHLHFESTRMRCENSVKRAGAMLLGLFSVVSLIYAEIAAKQQIRVYGTPCYHKVDPTFADALAAVRTLIWEKVILQHLPGGQHVAKLPLPAWQMLLDHLAAAA